MTPLETTFYQFSIAYITFNFIILIILTVLGIYLFWKFKQAQKKLKNLSKVATVLKVGGMLFGIISNFRKKL